MDIKPNNVIITNCVGIPMCFHIAVVCLYNGVLCVFHCTPTKTNVYGGNVICERLDQFLSNRKVKKMYPANVPMEKIIKNFDQVKYNKWDALNFNCETYINQLVNDNNGTTQLERLFFTCLLCGSVLL